MDKSHIYIQSTPSKRVKSHHATDESSIGVTTNEKSWIC